MLFSVTHIKIILFYLYVMSMLVFTLSCNHNKEKIKALQPPIERPTQKSKDIVILYSDSTRLQAVLKAREMVSYEKDQKDPFIFFPDSVKIIFYNEQQIPASTLTANQAVYFMKSQKAYLKYNVHFVNDKHENLYTESIEWNQNTGKITSDKTVKITTPTQIIYGNGIECEEDFSNYTIRNITGIIQINNESKTTNNESN